jgi:hypothetical protein
MCLELVNEQKVKVATFPWSNELEVFSGVEYINANHGPLKWLWLLHPGAKLELFVRGAIINIIKYNIYFTLLYMSCKKKPV